MNEYNKLCVNSPQVLNSKCVTGVKVVDNTSSGSFKVVARQMRVAGASDGLIIVFQTKKKPSVNKREHK